jgi:hypothetical protein
LIEESFRYRGVLRSAWRAAHADGDRRPIDGLALRREVGNGDGLGMMGGGDRRRDGAVKDILRMPVPGPIAVGRRDYRGIGRGGRAVRVVMVMLRFGGGVLVSMSMIVILIFTIDMDVQAIAVGVVVEVEPGPRHRDRRHEESEGQRGPHGQSPAYPPHRGCGLAHPAHACHGTPARQKHLRHFTALAQATFADMLRRSATGSFNEPAISTTRCVTMLGPEEPR